MTKEKFGFVYIWYDIKRKMYYIGSHWGTEDDGYICSSNRMRNVYKRRPEDFRRRILARTGVDRKMLFDLEEHWLQKVKKKERYYNLHFTVHHWAGKLDTSHIKEKISKSKKGKPIHSDEYREVQRNKAIGKQFFGSKLTKDEIGQRISAGAKGKPKWPNSRVFSDESKKKMSDAKKGYTPWNKGKTLKHS